ncbi:MAG: stage V sporulation protein E [Chitinivibrionales bacterium]|nr:stage V sporulation protein E [Chitinivibrionales bacterium]
MWSFYPPAVRALTCFADSKNVAAYSRMLCLQSGRMPPMHKQNASPMTFGIIAAVLFLVGCGIVLVYSSSFVLAQAKYGGSDFFLARQAIRAAIAFLCFLVFMKIDYHVWGKISGLVYIAAIGLLVAVLVLPQAEAIKGARRWIDLGFARFQVTELARIAVVLVIANKYHEFGDELHGSRRLLEQIVKMVLITGLIMLEPDFSTAFMIAALGLAMLFVAGVKLWYFGGLLVGLAAFAGAAIALAPYRFGRWLAFLQVGKFKDSIGYQAHQSLIGLGSGGLLGRGLGQGEQKYFYLPEPHTDFAFAILGEEVGFIGLVAILLVFAFVIFRGFRISRFAPDRLGQLMAFGFTLALALYVGVHVCVNVVLVPTTGVPLPFLSYGGMSLIFTMSTIGMLLNIANQAGAKQPETKHGLKASRKVRFTHAG